MAKAPKPEPLPEVQFGIRWSKVFSNEYLRRRYCARMKVGTTPQWEHRKWLSRFLWPSDQDLAQHEWTERRIKSFCAAPWVTWLGPAASSKSTDAAAMAIQWWLEAPDETAVVVCSTSLNMLKRRIWSEVVRLHNALPKSFGYAGELLPSGTIVRWKPGDDKHGIFGIAIGEGSIDEAKSNLVGIHAKRVWWIIDEMQGVKPAILDGYTLGNLAKNPESHLLGMGNPSNMEDPLCRHSRPVQGWNSIVRFQKSWKTVGGPVGEGVCEFFDGRESPAILNPEWGKKNPWMINGEQIAKHLVFVGGNENDPAFCSQSIGWPPEVGTESTVLDPAIVETFHCRDKQVWTNGWVQMASFDPAFTFGGDRRILQFFKLGKVTTDSGTRWVLEFGEWFNVPISDTAKNADGTAKPVEYQMMEFCRDQCVSRGVTPANFALDSSGRGGSLKAIFDASWGIVVGVEFGGEASELPVKSFVDSTGKLIIQYAHEIYARRVAELNLCVREFALTNGLRGLSDDAIAQACARKTFFKGGKWGVQSKKEMSTSPDNLDAVAIACELARQKGAVIMMGPVVRTSKNWEDMVKKASQDFDSENYTQPQDWEVA